MKCSLLKHTCSWRDKLIALFKSVFKKGKNDYVQVFLEKCKHVVQGKKMLEYISDDIEIYSDDYGREDSDEENYDKEKSEENFNEETYV